jgi:hypothetical protein
MMPKTTHMTLTNSAALMFRTSDPLFQTRQKYTVGAGTQQAARLDSWVALFATFPREPARLQLANKLGDHIEATTRTCPINRASKRPFYRVAICQQCGSATPGIARHAFLSRGIPPSGKHLGAARDILIGFRFRRVKP